jgi:hypothetical protein
MERGGEALTNTVVARLDRAIQYAVTQTMNEDIGIAGYPAFAGYDG